MSEELRTLLTPGHGGSRTSVAAVHSLHPILAWICLQRQKRCIDQKQRRRSPQRDGPGAGAPAQNQGGDTFGVYDLGRSSELSVALTQSLSTHLWSM